MVRKKIDSRVKALIMNGVTDHHRSFFVIVGDRGRDQIVNLHYILTKAAVKAKPSVLWCYKSDLGFSSHRKKRMRQIKKAIERGILDPNKDDPFELFISSTNIRYCYYKDTHKILGNTYGMCVLQDFEAITPNTLARTIETVEGGGLVVLLLKTMSSLKQLYTLNMDVHQRYRTESQKSVGHRFNERFLLSLASCPTCLVTDDELNILPISSHIRSLTAKPPKSSDDEDPAMRELQETKESLSGTEPIGTLVGMAKTLDQARAILTFMEAAQEKTLRSTVALTAARGRGKSAALGVAMAGAVAYGYANIFVTSPSPENLTTLFEFIFKTFDALGYIEHTHYEIVRSINPEFNQAVVRVNIFRDHRQTIQYVQPQDHVKLAQAELVVIDEAAAIPLPYVKELLGPYLVFMASTINGYEGTGRSLSLKLLDSLRKQSASLKSGEGGAASGASGRVLREVALECPIRYAVGDAVEAWLNGLLCLDVANVARVGGTTPHPDSCELYYVTRDTLFSYHKASESFLHQMMALYVASHYRNTPNDLQMLADAPAHNLFVLLGPVDAHSPTLPEVLVVLQVCLEGNISRSSVAASLGRGERSAGDLIPWTLAQQFQDHDFAGLCGARIVRIATHPDYNRMGYASRAMSLLMKYYQGEIPIQVGADAGDDDNKANVDEDGNMEGVALTEQVVRPRTKLPPLLRALSERAPERLHYVGVAYGITQQLYNFWGKSGFVPVYVRQTENDLTGEHTCIMLRELHSSDLLVTTDADWLSNFHTDFRRRFIQLLSYNLRKFKPALALTILDPPQQGTLTSSEFAAKFSTSKLTRGQLQYVFTPFDLSRLEAYTNNLVDHHVIMDLVPALAELYFSRKIPVSMPVSQAVVLLCIGLQRDSVDAVEKAISTTSAHVLALFHKAVAKIFHFLRALEEEHAAAGLPSQRNIVEARSGHAPVSQSLDADLAEGAQEVLARLHGRAEKGKSGAAEKESARVSAKTKGKGKAPVEDESDSDDNDNDNDDSHGDEDDGTSGSQGGSRRRGHGVSESGGGGGEDDDDDDDDDDGGSASVSEADKASVLKKSTDTKKDGGKKNEALAVVSSEFSVGGSEKEWAKVAGRSRGVVSIKREDGDARKRRRSQLEPNDIVTEDDGVLELPAFKRMKQKGGSSKKAGKR